MINPTWNPRCLSQSPSGLYTVQECLSSELKIPRNAIITGDALKKLQTLPGECIHCCVTSPPYWGLRDYGMKGQIGLEADLDQYVEQMVFVFREVRRVLRPDGTLWLNLGDSYPPVGNLTPHRGDRENRCQSALGFDRSHLKNELKPKNTLGVPWRIALALQADGWILRQDIIWAKANPMPESVKDRCTKSHEYIFLFVKSEHYYFDTIAAMEPAMGRPSGNNVRKNSSERGCPRLGGVAGNVPWAGGEMRKRRSVWTIPVGKGVGSHHAAFPPALAQPCVQMGCPLGGIVLDPFLGTGTTLSVANRLGRSGVGIELNPKYVELAGLRLKEDWIRQFGLVGT